MSQSLQKEKQTYMRSFGPRHHARHLKQFKASGEDCPDDARPPEHPSCDAKTLSSSISLSLLFKKAYPYRPTTAAVQCKKAQVARDAAQPGRAPKLQYGGDTYRWARSSTVVGVAVPVGASTWGA